MLEIAYPDIYRAARLVWEYINGQTPIDIGDVKDALTRACEEFAISAAPFDTTGFVYMIYQGVEYYYT